MKKDLIVWMGGPGVGKGTFSKMLLQQHDYKHIETGAMLRELPADSEIGQMIARGELVPDSALFDLIASKLTDDKDILLDGFPRKVSQAQWLVENFANKFNMHIIYLNVPEQVIIARLNKRLNEGSTRADDADPAVIRRRIDTFINTTMPAVEWLRTAPGIKFSDIDVSGELNDNYNNIIQALNNK